MRELSDVTWLVKYLCIAYFKFIDSFSSPWIHSPSTSSCSHHYQPNSSRDFHFDIHESMVWRWLLLLQKYPRARQYRERSSAMKTHPSSTDDIRVPVFCMACTRMLWNALALVQQILWCLSIDFHLPDILPCTLFQFIMCGRIITCEKEESSNLHWRKKKTYALV